MSIKIFVGNIEVPHQSFQFPGGEVQVRITGKPPGYRIRILAHIHKSADLLELLLVTNALKKMRQPGEDQSIELMLPYVPYARQDRVCVPGEALAIEVLADIINAQNYSRVYMLDAHSDVAPALIKNAVNRGQEELLGLFILPSGRSNTVLVAPDAGAIKKTHKVATWLGFKEVVRADKLRNVSNGEITDTVVYSDHIGNRDFLIVDDICDGGRTFVELAKKLRPLTDGNVNLYVTHGIFSRGIEVFDGLIDKIYVANIFNQFLANGGNTPGGGPKVFACEENTWLYL